MYYFVSRRGGGGGGGKIARLSYLLRPPLQFLGDGGAEIGAGDRRCPCGAITGRCVCRGRGVVRFIGPGRGGGDRAVRNGRRWLAGGRR